MFWFIIYLIIGCLVIFALNLKVTINSPRNTKKKPKN